jgi:diguanylate cyclase (GGDEF)-like protein
MENDLIFNLISARIDQLPTLPGIAIRLLKAIQSPDPNMNDISLILSSDAALTAKILRLVNSSFYSLRSPVSTVDHATKLLGLNAVKNLALSFSLVSNSLRNNKKSFNYNRFWKDSLIGAIAAKLLAESVQPKLSEEAFFLGLLQNIGSLILAHCLPDQYGLAMASAEKDGGGYHRAESHVFGFNHMEVGEYLTKSWGLPESFFIPIGHHHSPQNADDKPTATQIRTRLLHLSSLYIDLFNAPEMALGLGIIDHRVREYGFADTIDPANVGAQIQLHAREVFPVFDIEVKDNRDYSTILQSAKAEMQKLSVELVQELLEKNKEIDFLRSQTTQDSMTCISNYKGFCECLSREMNRAYRYKSPLSLIFSDIDHFKMVNDTYGHLAGDHALKATALCLKQQLRQSDYIARYGGEEFALILTETDLQNAIRVAERLREKIALQNITYQKTTISLTMSFGVAALPLDSKLSSDALIKMADDALYRAKGLGRNRCCVAGRD